MALSASEITPEVMDVRYNSILKSLVKNNDLEFSMFILQLSNWPNVKRRQLFRRIFKTLLSETRKFDWNVFKPFIANNFDNIRGYQLDSVFIKSRFLDKIINKIKQMEANNKFKLEKVLTLSTVQSSVLMMSPNSIKYMLDSTILILGNKTSIGSYNEAPFKGILQKTRYYSNTLQHAKKVYEFYNIDTDLIYDYRKMILVLGTNCLKNITSIVNTLSNRGVTKDCRDTVQELLQLSNSVMFTTGTQPFKLLKCTRRDWESVEAACSHQLKSDALTDTELLKLKGGQANYMTETHRIMQKILNPEQAVDEEKDQGFDPFIATI